MSRMSWSGALVSTLALLVACQSEAPQAPVSDSPSFPSGPSLAVGFYGIAGAPAAPAGRPCRAPEYRQFDFWVGEWEVLDPAGADAGTNSLTVGLDKCAVFEDYSDAGFRGRSLNSYDAATGQWHQHWADNNALSLILGGSFNGEMILDGFRPPVSLDRITWTALSENLVRQLWEVSTDGGLTFPTVRFDGFYHRRPSVVHDPEEPAELCHDATRPFYRDFDFIVGNWDVDVITGRRAEAALENANLGQPELESVITSQLSDCLIEERLSGHAGFEASVFHSTRRSTGAWLRTYVDNRGIRVFLSGGRVNGQMVLTGNMPTAEGNVDVRSTWEEVDTDHFVQRYETSRDGGATWELLAQLEYRRT